MPFLIRIYALSFSFKRETRRKNFFESQDKNQLKFCRESNYPFLWLLICSKTQRLTFICSTHWFKYIQKLAVSCLTITYCYSRLIFSINVNRYSMIYIYIQRLTFLYSMIHIYIQRLILLYSTILIYIQRSTFFYSTIHIYIQRLTFWYSTIHLYIQRLSFLYSTIQIYIQRSTFFNSTFHIYIKRLTFLFNKL